MPKKQKRYRVAGIIEKCVIADIEASSPRQALKKARNLCELKWEETNWESGVQKMMLVNRKKGY